MEAYIRCILGYYQQKRHYFCLKKLVVKKTDIFLNQGNLKLLRLELFQDYTRSLQAWSCF